MSETWIVAHDFSPCSDAATFEAARLLAPLGGKMRLLHVHAIEHIPPQEAWGEQTFALENSIRLRLMKVAEAVKERHPDMAVEVDVSAGEPAKRILSEAARAGVDHIVVGTHGRTGIAHLVLGSVAEKVVREAKVPVLVVKDGRA